MLPKKNRLNLRKRTDFFKQAQRYYSPLFTIHFQLREKENQGELEEKKTAEGKPAEGKPAEGKTAEGKPADEKSTDGKPTKATVIVKKKDFKTAVARHQLTRKGRSALLPFLKKKRPLDLALVFKRQAAKADFKKIQQEIEKFDQWLQSRL